MNPAFFAAEAFASAQHPHTPPKLTTACVRAMMARMMRWKQRIMPLCGPSTRESRHGRSDTKILRS